MMQLVYVDFDNQYNRTICVSTIIPDYMKYTLSTILYNILYNTLYNTY